MYVVRWRYAVGGKADPTVQKQRGKWTVRQAGYDPSTGRRKVLQLGTFETKRAATERARSVAEGRVGSSAETVGEYVSKVWLGAKEGRVERSTFGQYRWAVRSQRRWRPASRTSTLPRAV
jgi:hypothetical protein